MKSSDELIIANMNIQYFRYPFSYFLENQVALGFDSFLFWGSVPHIWVDQFGYEDVTELKEMIRKHKVNLLAYAARPYNYSLFAPKGSLQRKYTESYYRFCIDIAQKLETNQICVELWGDRTSTIQRSTKIASKCWLICARMQKQVIVHLLSAMFQAPILA